MQSHALVSLFSLMNTKITSPELLFPTKSILVQLIANLTSPLRYLPASKTQHVKTHSWCPLSPISKLMPLPIPLWFQAASPHLYSFRGLGKNPRNHLHCLFLYHLTSTPSANLSAPPSQCVPKPVASLSLLQRLLQSAPSLLPLPLLSP